ncbi:MAG: hypothetical protein JOY77_03195 [Alphaproteobacteria bacterium]|nr:hypothetical protein [Alphaproteobacteria bacterium]MBV9061918.1 hypothetical protein [Alphaproteobacteria bacterium]
MPKAASAADIRSLARRLREIAATMAMDDYAALMTRAAAELERRAVEVETSRPCSPALMHLKAVA